MFATQYLCPAGTFNNGTSQTSQSSCEQCWPGYYCEGEGLSEPSGVCDPGFYCAGGSAMKRPGDFGILDASAANISCYSQCVCPAFNTSTGTYRIFLLLTVEYFRHCHRAPRAVIGSLNQ